MITLSFCPSARASSKIAAVPQCQLSFSRGDFDRSFSGRRLLFGTEGSQSGAGKFKSKQSCDCKRTWLPVNLTAMQLRNYNRPMTGKVQKKHVSLHCASMRFMNLKNMSSPSCETPHPLPGRTSTPTTLKFALCLLVHSRQNVRDFALVTCGTQAMSASTHLLREASQLNNRESRYWLPTLQRQASPHHHPTLHLVIMWDIPQI